LDVHYPHPVVPHVNLALLCCSDFINA
jgi:hypothetical protein